MREENMIALLLIMMGSMLFLVGLLVEVWYVPILATILILAGIVFAIFMGYAYAPERMRKNASSKLFGKRGVKSKPPSNIRTTAPGGKTKIDPYSRRSK